MAGVYFHIPFCKQKCSYCDFHFSTDTSYGQEMMACLAQEFALRKHELTEPIKTIYFGGGTPSLMSATDIAQLIDCVRATGRTESMIECTIEANPDDITAERLERWKSSGVNRLSIGIQSFDETVLDSMNRAHDSEQAHVSIQRARDAGFDNISVDLIYGLPQSTLASFKIDLDHFLALDVEHISAYNLTIEPNTLYGNLAKKGALKLPDDELVAEQFIALRSALASAGYEQYEVSNFSKPGWHSQHNSAYWKSHKYIGIGPSAHSFNGHTRAWNVANNHRYMGAIKDKTLALETEVLSLDDQFNEYVLTRSRTKWGLDLAYIHETFDIDLKTEYAKELKGWKKNLDIIDNHLILNQEGLLLADAFAQLLFRLP